MKNDNIHSVFSLFCLQILNLPASLQNKNTRVGPFSWKRSVLQNPDRERTNQSTGICLRLDIVLSPDLFSHGSRSSTSRSALLEVPIYLRGMRDRSMRSGTELAREIQLTDWSTAEEQGKLVFVVSTTRHHWRNLFHFSQREKIVFRSSKLHTNSSFSL